MQMGIATGGYMACSALLLILNKNALYYIAAPCSLLFLQCASTAAFAAMAYSWEHRGAIFMCTQHGATIFLPAACIFTATVLTNMCALKYNNVDTLMAFRFATPLMIAPCESLFMGREYPSFRMWVSLIFMFGGTAGFLFGDVSIGTYDGLWLCVLWYCAFCVDQLYLKHICTVTDDNYSSTWIYVYYSNMLPLPLLAAFVLLYERGDVLYNADNPSTDAILAITTSVALAVAMSYFSWKARSLLSAASFTLAGNICKLLTLVLNYALWDKHSSAQSTIFLLVALAGAGIYKQAPLRQSAEYRSVAQQQGDYEISAV